MRRTPYRVETAVRQESAARDRRASLSKIEPGHVCRNIWGDVHAPDDVKQLSLEHVKMTGSMMGKRAPSTAQSMIALCAWANVRVPNRSQRNAMRAYLRALYPVAA